MSNTAVQEFHCGLDCVIEQYSDSGIQCGLNCVTEQNSGCPGVALSTALRIE